MTLSNARLEMTDYLQRQGVHALGAWDGGDRLRHGKGVVVVSLRETESGSAGFQHYLGEREDPELGVVSIYGKQLRLVFGLDLYAPREQGDGCAVLFDQLAGIFSVSGPEDIVPGTLRCGEISYDRECGMLICPCQLECRGWIYAAVDSAGVPIRALEVSGSWNEREKEIDL